MRPLADTVLPSVKCEITTPGITPGVVTIEISDLTNQLVNIWPTEIATDCGTGQPFIFKQLFRDADGDVTHASYIQYPARVGDLELVVFND